MQTHQNLTLITLSLSSFFLSFLTCTTAARTQPQDLLHSSCTQARYPTLCVQTLSTYTGPTTTPLNLAQAAIKVSLAHARTLSAYLNTLQLRQTSNKRQRLALNDCAKQISDSVDELSKTLSELQHLRMGTFEWQMSNAMTWASAALTNGDTCINGFSDGGDRTLVAEVKRKVTDVAMLTSNALYLIDRVGQRRSGKPRVNH
ncbi:hypothetical protein RIF29_07198 [Crotalaria pallida]|uniref:Pectinesterase inhibitor domain-containing protein n=1 Tax=Crotalaria pallida TaxID=3830 RepID=A0AAN9PBQ6_CROPI